MYNKDFKIEFYQKDNGDIPALVFIDSLPDKFKVKIARAIDTLKEYGYEASKQLSKKIDDHIFELRIAFNSNYARILYFYHKDRVIVITSGFIKKTNKTPRNEILIAEHYRNNWLRRYENEKEKN